MKWKTLVVVILLLQVCVYNGLTPLWLVTWRSAPYRLNFDLHRASGLWTWVMLFILAWSSVVFNLSNEVYTPVTKLVFDMQDRLRRSACRRESATGSCTGLARGACHRHTVHGRTGPATRFYRVA